MSRLVLVCTYNERENLPRLLEAIRAAAPDAQVLVVDDGSPDGTGRWAQEAAEQRDWLRVIDRCGKLGLGSAIALGLREAMAQGYAWVINLDADFSHDPGDLPRLWRAALATTRDGDAVDVVIGSRYVEGGGLAQCSWKRVLVSRAANGYARFWLGWPIRDASSAYRAYRTAALSTLDWDQITCQGYGFLEEILWQLRERGARFVEVPIVYTERERGESKISFNEAWGTLQVIHRLAYRRWLRWWRPTST